jgi:hypothetical protein
MAWQFAWSAQHIGVLGDAGLVMSLVVGYSSIYHVRTTLPETNQNVICSLLVFWIKWYAKKISADITGRKRCMVMPK